VPGPSDTALPLGGDAWDLLAAAVISSTLPDGHPALTPHASYVKDAQRGWTYGHHPALTPELQAELVKAVTDRVEVFAYSMAAMPGYTGDMGEFHIELTHDRPIFEAPRRYSPLEREVGDKKCDEMLEAKIIGPSAGSKYACNPTMPAKKDAEGNWTDVRYCIDFRPINRETVHDKYGLHLPEDLFRDMSGSTVFSCLDLRSGFMQLPVAQESQPKTAFWWRNQLWSFNRLPFGLRNASAFFQRVLDYEIAKAGLGHCAMAFIDDVCIHSPSPEQHVKDVAAVLDMLLSCGLRVHPEKSVFGAQVVQYLGHNVSADGLTPQEAKIQAVKELRAPGNVSELRAILGFLGYYRCYIPAFSKLAAPMNDLLAKDARWQWGEAQQQALEALRAELCTPGKVLRQYDPSQPVFLHTDWSQQGISGVLGQKDEEGNEFMVACISRSLNKHERNYSSYEGEMLAAVWAIKTFRPYLMGVPFTLITDHQPLQWLMRNNELAGKHARWALSLMDYTFEVVHRPGVTHQNADVLSRFPSPGTFDGTGARLDEEAEGAVARHVAAAAALLGEQADKPAGLGAALACMPQPPTMQLDACAGWHQLLACTAAPQWPEPSSCPVWGGSELMADHMGDVGDAATQPCNAALQVEHAQQQLTRLAQAWVRAAAAAGLVQQAPASQPLVCAGVADAWGVRAAQQLDTTPVPAAFFAAALSEGITLYEPFGGLCAGLEMVLRCGMRVRRYIYSDTNLAARSVACWRVQGLGQLYTSQIAPGAFEGMFLSLPQDVRQVRSQQLVDAGAASPDAGWWMVVAGWECQDLSAAGSGKGLAGQRSRTFFDVLRILGTLQQLQPSKPPAFVIENTHMPSQAVRERDLPVIVRALGEPVLLDAAQVGSYAHRLRNYWVNLVPASWLRAVLAGVVRPEPPLQLEGQLLGPGRRCTAVMHPDPAPWHLVNVVGQPRRVMPTLVAARQSYAFRPQKPGAIYDVALQAWTEPCPIERECMLGYAPGSTAAPGVTDEQRHAITGRCMDAFAMQSLLSVSLALCSHTQGLAQALAAVPEPKSRINAYTLPPPPPDPVAILCAGNDPRRHAWATMLRSGWRPGGGLGAQGQGVVTPVPNQGWPPGQRRPPGLGYALMPVQAAGEALQPPILTAAAARASGEEAQPAQGAPPGAAELQLLACLAEEAEAPAMQGAASDVWDDGALLHYLRHGELPEAANAAERKRILRRARLYVWEGEQLYRRMSDGSVRQVPAPVARHQLVLDTHTSTGHWGEKRTLSLLMTSYWWRGMLDAVRRVVRSCEACDKARAAFNARLPELQPLPIMGLFYRWAVDLAGPFPATARSNVYVMLCIEHYSKHIELIPLPSKEAKHTASAFKSRVLCRYGAMAEVLTDGGREFEGEFGQLLSQALVDHRTTSPGHPQSDGLAERAVQSVKRALRRRCQDSKVGTEWDEDLPWVMLGYNCSKQAATGLSPYELLHAQQPTVPPAVRPRFEHPVDFDDAAAAEKQLLQRMELMRRNCAIAGENLAIAQHRDTLRYARVRSGDYQPQRYKFAVGDFAYLRRPSPEGLHMRVKPPIYRVKEVKPSGVVVLQGKCGRTVEHHLVNLAPCHLANIDPTIDVTLQRPDADLACDVCGHQDDEAEMLLCDECGTGWHCYCLVPPLLAVPDGEWVCPRCTAKGITVEAVQQRMAQQREHVRPAGAQEVNTGGAARRRAAALLRQADEAKRLDGRLIKKNVRIPGTRTWAPRVGRLQFMGPDSGPHFFVVEFEGGEKESMQLPTAEKYLLPAEAARPAAAAVQLAATGLEALPPVWALGEPAELRKALQQLMPGPWDARAVSRLSGQISAAREDAARGGQNLQCVPTAPEEVSWLLDRVQLAECRCVLEPFNGTGTITKMLRAAGLTVHSNDLSLARDAHLHSDALQPRFYTTIERTAQLQLDAIVTSPWFAVLDVALPLIVAAARVVACIHVPGHYISNGVEPRHAYLRQLQREGRLLVLFGLPRAATGWRCAWLIVFKSAAVKQRIMKAGWREGGLCLA
jgi:hypothetical protein